MLSTNSVAYDRSEYRGFVRKGYDSARFIEYLDGIEKNIVETLKRHYANFSKPTDRMVTVVEVPFADSTRKLMLKEDDFTRAPNAAKMIKYIFKPSRGERGWDASVFLADAGLLVPEPVAYVEKRKLGIFRRSFFFMEYVANARSLRDVLSGEGDKGALMAEAGTTIKRLHDLGCTHGDLKATNFLVREDEDGQRRLYLIDLEDVRMHSKIPRKKRLDDLVRFYKSSGDTAGNYVRVFLSGYGKDINTIDENISARELRARLSIRDSAAG
jgi:tRNA A-37 threonylcarbamoyl transferase component Bud32